MEMKPYELIQEAGKRGIEITQLADGRLRVAPLDAAKDLLEEMRKNRDLLLSYAAGDYRLTPECLISFVAGDNGSIHYSRIYGMFPPEMIRQAKRDMSVIEQVNGFFRLPTEKELEGRAAPRAGRRRAA